VGWFFDFFVLGSVEVFVCFEGLVLLWETVVFLFSCCERVLYTSTSNGLFKLLICCFCLCFRLCSVVRLVTSCSTIFATKNRAVAEWFLPSCSRDTHIHLFKESNLLLWLKNFRCVSTPNKNCAILGVFSFL
jgi:hypothetical protein